MNNSVDDFYFEYIPLKNTNLNRTSYQKMGSGKKGKGNGAIIAIGVIVTLAVVALLVVGAIAIVWAVNPKKSSFRPHFSSRHHHSGAAGVQAIEDKKVEDSKGASESTTQDLPSVEQVFNQRMRVPLPHIRTPTNVRMRNFRAMGEDGEGFASI